MDLKAVLKEYRALDKKASDKYKEYKVLCNERDQFAYQNFGCSRGEILSVDKLVEIVEKITEVKQ